MDKHDQIWFVIDTDTWGATISTLREKCALRENWNVAQSNPCFEVWLFYHLFNTFAGDIKLEGSDAWKQHVNTVIRGGFDSRKHPILLADAIANAEANFRLIGHEVAYGSTEVYRLGKAIYPLVAAAIDKAKKKFVAQQRNCSILGGE